MKIVDPKIYEEKEIIVSEYDRIWSGTSLAVLAPQTSIFEGWHQLVSKSEIKLCANVY